MQREDLGEKLEVLEKGEQFNMLLPPHSEAIWELTTEKSVILSLDDAKSRTQFENGFFMFFWLIMLDLYFTGSDCAFG